MSASENEHPPLRIDIEARHVRLRQTHIDALFGRDHELTPLMNIGTEGCFAAAECLTVRGPSGEIADVRVVGPTVKQSRVELVRADQERLGMEPNDPLSRRLDTSEGCVLAGPKGTVVLADGVLFARRHLELTKEDAQKRALSDGDRVSVRVAGDRARVFTSVPVDVVGRGESRLVLELEDAGSVDLHPGSLAFIESGE